MDTTRQPLRALIVEDRPHDAELLAATLENAGYGVIWSRVDNAADYQLALDAAPDIILSDYSLPNFSGLRALVLLQQQQLDIPFIIVSGTIDDEQAVSVMRAGADDYLLKDRLARLGAAVGTACEKTRLRRAKQQAEEQLRESNLQLRAFLDNSPALMFIKDASGRYLQINQRFAAAFGRDPAQIIGRSDTEIFDAGQAAQFQANDHAVLRAGKPVEFEETARYRDGLHASIVTKFPLRDAQGNIYGLGGIATDITARKREEERFQATFEQAAVGIVHTSLDRRYLAVNQKFCDMMGYSRDELLGKDTADITHPDDRVEDGAHRNRLLAGEIQTYTAEKRYMRKDGSIFCGHRTVSLARDSAGQPMYFIRVIEDITPRKRLEKRMEQTLEQAAVGIVRVSLDQCIIDVNRKFCQMTGYDREELLRMTVIQISHPDDRGQDVARREQLTAGAIEYFRSEKRYVRKNGDIIWVRRTTSLARDLADDEPHYIIVVEDVTDRKTSEESYRATFDNAPVGIMHSTADRRILHVNRKLCEILGYTQEELLAMTTADIISPDSLESNRPLFLQQMLNGEMQTFSSERAFIRKDGTAVWTNRTISLVRDAGGQPLYFLRLIEDITARKLSEQAQRDIDEKFRQLANHIPQIFWMTDIEQKSLIYASPAYERITGRALAELQADPRCWLETIHENDRARVKNARKNRAASGNYDIEYRLVLSDCSIRWIHDRAFPVQNAKGEAYRIAGIAEDITERKQTQEQLAHLAHYDSLTGLPNRVLFNDRLRQVVAQARRNHWIVGVLFLDLDRFKLVNDTLGHASGDLLLKQVASRLSECLRPTDTVGRLSGDEFAVILSELAEAQNAGYVAQKILDALAAPFNLEGSEVFVTASIGITLYPSDSESIDTLIRDADAAMYGAKAAGRNNYQYYTAAMNARALEKLRLETGIRRALERNELLLHYQPKIDIASGNISGLEALLRWQSPEQGLISPAQFIPLLEDSGLIVPVGEWVTRVVCAQLQAWRQAGVKPVPVAINLSARQLRQQGYAEVLDQAMQEYGIDPELIHVEITESSLMENPEEAILVLQELKALGIRLEADDFGTGYSSLSYLKRFPLDALKIDRSFVHDITIDEDDAVIAKAVISLAHSLGLTVVAEGVETEEQLAFLSINRCDEAQGYLFAHPLPVDDCTALLGAGFPPCHRAAEGAERVPAILIVDDNAGDLELTRLSLQKDGHTILAAGSSHDAFKLLAGNSVGIVIADANMPEMSGVEFLRQIKLMYPEVLRIMQSGTEDFSTAAAAINEGEVHKFFVKGQDNELLRREIKRKIWHAPGYHIPLRSAAPRRPGRPQRRLTSD